MLGRLPEVNICHDCIYKNIHFIYVLKYNI